MEGKYALMLSVNWPTYSAPRKLIAPKVRPKSSTVKKAYIPRAYHPYFFIVYFNRWVNVAFSGSLSEAAGDDGREVLFSLVKDEKWVLSPPFWRGERGVLRVERKVGKEVVRGKSGRAANPPSLVNGLKTGIRSIIRDIASS